MPFFVKVQVATPERLADEEDHHGNFPDALSVANGGGSSKSCNGRILLLITIDLELGGMPTVVQRTGGAAGRGGRRAQMLRWPVCRGVGAGGRSACGGGSGGDGRCRCSARPRIGASWGG